MSKNKVCNACGRNSDCWNQCKCSYVICADCLKNFEPTKKGSMLRTILTGSSGGYYECPRCGNHWRT